MVLSANVIRTFWTRQHNISTIWALCIFLTYNCHTVWILQYNIKIWFQIYLLGWKIHMIDRKWTCNYPPKTRCISSGKLIVDFVLHFTSLSIITLKDFPQFLWFYLTYLFHMQAIYTPFYRSISLQNMKIKASENYGD